MTGLNRMTGTPWHVEKYTREEGDDRRHRSKCTHYNRKTSYCSKVVGKCVGSAHCRYYKSFSAETQYENPQGKSQLKEKKNRPEKLCLEKDALRKSVLRNSRRLLPKGTIILHSQYGEGMISENRGDTIIVKFNSNGIKKLDVFTCVNKEMIEVIRR